jgi:hypothetical protein
MPHSGIDTDELSEARTSQIADPLEIKDDVLHTSSERLVDGGPQGPGVAVGVSSGDREHRVVTVDSLLYVHQNLCC